ILGANLSYTEPLGNRKYLEVNYNIRQNKNDINRMTYNPGGELMDSLSNVYNSNYVYQRGGLNLRINREQFSLTLGAAFQQTVLDGEILRPASQAAPINNTFANILPAVHFNYDFDNNMRLRMDYETSMQAPTIQQLTPVRDVTNLPNITEGDPNLDPSYQHSMRLNFSKFDPVTFISFFTFVNASYTIDAITNSLEYNITDSITTTTSKPINRDNASLSGNTNVSFPLTKLFSRLNIGVNVLTQRSVNVSRELEDGELLNDFESDINQLTLGGNLRYTFTYKEIFDLSFSTRLSQQRTNYESANNTDQKYFNKTYTTEANYNFLKYYRLSGTFNYMEYENLTNKSTVSIPMLNFSLSRYVLKANAVEIKVGVNNVLNRNLGVTQTANNNYFERQTMNSLGRYYMVSFTYAINRHLNPMGGGRRGSGPRMIMMGGQ
ncbi:MAG TPA: outer membrane beta-barrel protein, partial [Cyclobacteriaceae bacterium]|nr:outer membrane beta-barrel protein [Cyclobacteriaceae bacterium]